MPLPLTVSCFSKIQIGFTFLVQAHPGSPGKRAVKRLCVCVCVCVCGLCDYCGEIETVEHLLINCTGKGVERNTKDACEKLQPDFSIKSMLNFTCV